jgi:RNA-directed DNA polymerase
VDEGEAKTSLRNARQERFDFLGYSFGAHWFEANGKWYLGASPSKKECAAAQDKGWRSSGAEQYRSMAGGT